MTIDANAMLRTLGGLGGVGGHASVGASKTAKNSGETAGSKIDFAQLLAQARAGQIHSGIKVTQARDAGVQLNDEQLSRLSAAADLAEANGIGRGLFLIDGQHVVMDVASRQVLGSVMPSQAGVIEGVDGVINVPAMTDATSPGSSQPKSLTPGAGLATMSNPSLLQALVDRGTRAA